MDMQVPLKITARESDLRELTDFVQTQSDQPVNITKDVDEGETLHFDPTLADLAALVALVRNAAWLASAPKFFFDYLTKSNQRKAQTVITIKSPKGVIQIEASGHLTESEIRETMRSIF